MTPLTITRWLEEPSALPEEAAINSLLENQPWFVPARMMQAVQAHRKRSYGPAALTLIELYAPEWLLAYNLLHKSGIQPVPAPEETAPNAAEEIPAVETEMDPKTEIPLLQPLYTEDYFRHQGVELTPEDQKQEPEDPRTLMVMMSFSEWLNFYKTKTQKEEEEERDKRALRSMWQQEKLAAALDDEPEEIPEDVFEMAVSSIAREDDIVSESLAVILEKQEKWAAAAEMYRKLGLRNPAKSAYFATRAEAAKKRIS